MKVFKVVEKSSGSWVAFKSKDAAEGEIEGNVECGDSPDAFEIQECEMTEKEYNNLPEFEGF